MEEPNLLKEIGKVAWLMVKVIGAAAAVLGALCFGLQSHPVLAVSLSCGLLLTAIIIYVGLSTYNWKKKDFERRKNDQERDREWNEGRARRQKSA